MKVLKKILGIILTFFMITIAEPYDHLFENMAEYGQSMWGGYGKVIINNSNTLLCLEKNTSRLSIISIKYSKLLNTINFDKTVNDVCVSQNRKFLYAACGESDGVVQIINSKNGKALDEIPAGHHPVSPVLDEKANRLYLLNPYEGYVSVINLKTRDRQTFFIGREPSRCVLSQDGNTLIITHLLPEQESTADTVAAKVTFLNTQNFSIKSILLPNGSSAAHDLVLSADGRLIFIPHIIARYNLPTSQLERGWMNTNALSIIDVKSQSLYKTVLIDDIDLGAANPRGVAISEDGQFLCVAHTGTHEVSLIGIPQMLEKLKSAENTVNQLGFLYDCRERISITGFGPRNVVIKDHHAYVSNYYSDSIDIIDLDSKRTIKTIQPEKPKLAEHEIGDFLFNNATTCFQHWQSCESCHPNARVDGFNWDLMNDFIGNPKNVKSLLYAHATPPMNWTGIRPDAQSSVRAGMLHIQFNVVNERDVAAMDVYLQMLEPITSPYLVKGELSESAKRGEQLFNNDKVGCASCHPAPYFTDQFLYDIGTTSKLDSTLDRSEKLVPQKEFDTPTLIECWQTAPYLHDGRYKSIKDVITIGNKNDLHGHTSHLSEREIDDLVEYVRSL